MSNYTKDDFSPVFDDGEAEKNEAEAQKNEVKSETELGAQPEKKQNVQESEVEKKPTAKFEAQTDETSEPLKRRDRKKKKDNSEAASKNDSETDFDNKDKKTRDFGVIKKILITVAAVAVILAGVAAALVFTMPNDVVYSGVTCSGIDLGNMSYDEALTALSEKISVDISDISVNVNGTTYPISQEEIELSPLLEETANKVYNFGKGDNQISNAYNAIRLKFESIDVLPVTTLNEEKLSEKFIEIGNTELGERKPHSAVVIDDTHAQLVPGTRGYDCDTDSAVAQFKAAIAEDKYSNIIIVMNAADPDPLTVEEVEAVVNKDATDAKFTTKNGEVTVVSEQNGRYVDKTECEALISTLSVGGENIDLPCYAIEATKKAADLKTKLFNGVLGQYTTTFAAGGNRGMNVSNAASRINGTVLLPDETFSFNKTVGKRSEANGFKTAPEYVNGETVAGIGGGTCQVSTTLYSAVLYADLNIVSRRNHSMTVGYVPLGQDATVTDGGTDFKFKNDTEYPIKIVAGTSGGSLTVKIVGTEPDVKKTVKLTHTPVSVSTGSAVQSTRTVYDESGNVLKTENLGISRYKPHS